MKKTDGSGIYENLIFEPEYEKTKGNNSSLEVRLYVDGERNSDGLEIKNGWAMKLTQFRMGKNML